MTWGLTGQICGGWPVIRQANPRWRPWSWSQNYENGHTLCLHLKLQMVTDSTEASYFLLFQVFVLRCDFLSVHSLNTQTWKKPTHFLHWYMFVLTQSFTTALFRHTQLCVSPPAVTTLYEKQVQKLLHNYIHMWSMIPECCTIWIYTHIYSPPLLVGPV